MATAVIIRGMHAVVPHTVAELYFCGVISLIFTMVCSRSLQKRFGRKRQETGLGWHIRLSPFYYQPVHTLCENLHD